VCEYDIEEKEGAMKILYDHKVDALYIRRQGETAAGRDAFDSATMRVKR